jgi:hypothetical protein
LIAKEYLGMIWPPALMPVRKDSVDEMMQETANREWLKRHAQIYDRRAWWVLAGTGILLGLTPYAIALFIPALHIRVQVWRMIGATKNEAE